MTGARASERSFRLHRFMIIHIEKMCTIQGAMHYSSLFKSYSVLASCRKVNLFNMIPV